jgi:hypothetical protein
MADIKMKKSNGVLGTWKIVINLILSEPKVLLPYIYLAIIEIFVLWILSCSPHFPLNVVFGPPIKNIWGAIYLHYPFFYELLPRMFYFAKIMADIFLGSITAGMAVLLVYTLKKKQPVDFKDIFKTVMKRYVTLFILAVILFGATYFLMRQPPVLLLKFFHGHKKLLFLGPKFWFPIFLPAFNFFLAVVFQALFVYSFPYAVLKGKKFLAALFLGARLFFKTFLKTFIVVLVPMILYIPTTMVRNNQGILADKFNPEIIVVILFAGIFVGTVIVDALVTIATTTIFIEVADEK